MLRGAANARESNHVPNSMISWGDYSATLWTESWPAKEQPRTVIYFGGALADPVSVPPFSDRGYPDRMKQRVFGACTQWLMSHGSLFWPGKNGAAPEAQAREMPEAFDFWALARRAPITGTRSAPERDPRKDADLRIDRARSCPNRRRGHLR